MKFTKAFLAAGALCLAACLAVPAQAVTLFSSTQGDLNFSGLTPNKPGTPAAAISGSSVTTPGAISGATVTSTGLATAGALTVDTGTKTATATGTTTATATLNKDAGVITSASLTTAAGGTYVLTLTNSSIAATDQVFASVATAGTGMPTVANVVEGAGQVVITVQNIHASAAFNNVIKIKFLVLKN